MQNPHSGAINNCEETAAPSVSLRPRLSLTLWLTFCNALCAFLLISLIATVLYFVLARELQRENHRHLHHEIISLHNLVFLEERLDPLIVEVSEDPSGEIEYIKRYVRFMDPEGGIVVETPGMRRVIPPRIFPPAQDDPISSEDTRWRNRNGRTLLASALSVEMPGRPGEQGVLQVALDITREEEILAECRECIYLALLVGLLLSVAISLSIARRGTRPLKEMADMVRRITVSNLAERIPASAWSRELDTMADALNLMLSRLEDSFSRLYLSATNLSHKMRTPLTILRGEAEVALSRNRSAEELEDVIASSLEEITRLSRLGENILFLANAEMGKFQLERSLLDCREEVEQVVDYHSPAAEEKGVSITCAGQATVTADGALFRKLIAALVSNAVTYNSPGGTVAVTLRQTDTMSAEVIVSDSGCGIPAGETGKVFDRFYRIYQTRHRDPHGTGLGLPLARAIMELHQGTIALKSVPGESTTVTASFPAPAAAADSSSAPPATPPK